MNVFRNLALAAVGLGIVYVATSSSASTASPNPNPNPNPNPQTTRYRATPDRTYTYYTIHPDKSLLQFAADIVGNNSAIARYPELVAQNPFLLGLDPHLPASQLPATFQIYTTTPNRQSKLVKPIVTPVSWSQFIADDLNNPDGAGVPFPKRP